MNQSSLSQHLKALEKDILQNMCELQRQLATLANASAQAGGSVPAVPIRGIFDKADYSTPVAKAAMDYAFIKGQMNREANALQNLRANGPAFAQTMLDFLYTEKPTKETVHPKGFA